MTEWGSKKIVFRADDSLANDIEKEAEEKNVTRSEAVRTILRQYFADKKIEEEDRKRVYGKLDEIAGYLKKMSEGK